MSIFLIYVSRIMYTRETELTDALVFPRELSQVGSLSPEVLPCVYA